jgi:hypothetical protein
MLSHLACVEALRTQLLTLSVCTTGSATLSATATGYARTTGSFLTDGFAVGMEITPTGFAANTVAVLTGVTALTLTTAARAVEVAAAGRTIACLLPAGRAWENVAYTPTTNRPWVEEDYLPGPAQQIPLGSLGDVETLPQYVVKVYGVPGTGLAALHRYGDAILNLFPPRTALTLSTGDVLRVRINPAPYRGQLVQDTAGFAVTVVTIPCAVRSANTI